ncbi:hypothetical protein C8R45DRAFT_928991 [Mycena sanguinolenta]|nr:hypothetical protein C8R45DRAFT_928991 [Mycena sanguinolenta]
MNLRTQERGEWGRREAKSGWGSKEGKGKGRMVTDDELRPAAEQGAGRIRCREGRETHRRWRIACADPGDRGFGGSVEVDLEEGNNSEDAAAAAGPSEAERGAKAKKSGARADAEVTGVFHSITKRRAELRAETHNVGLLGGLASGRKRHLEEKEEAQRWGEKTRTARFFENNDHRAHCGVQVVRAGLRPRRRCPQASRSSDLDVDHSEQDVETRQRREQGQLQLRGLRAHNSGVEQR